MRLGDGGVSDDGEFESIALVEEDGKRWENQVDIRVGNVSAPRAPAALDPEAMGCGKACLDKPGTDALR